MLVGKLVDPRSLRKGNGFGETMLLDHKVADDGETPNWSLLAFHSSQGGVRKAGDFMAETRVHRIGLIRPHAKVRLGMVHRADGDRGDKRAELGPNGLGGRGLAAAAHMCDAVVATCS